MHAYNITAQNFQLKKTYLNTIFKFYENITYNFLNVPNF